MFRLTHHIIYVSLLTLSCILSAAGQVQPCQQGTLADVLGTSCSVGSLILNFRTPFTGAGLIQQQGNFISFPINASDIGFIPVQVNGQVGYKLVLNFVLGPGADPTFVGDQLVQFGYTPQAVEGSEIRAVQLQIDATAQAPPPDSAIADVLDFQTYPNTGFLATDAFFAIDPSFTFPPEHLTDHAFLEVPSTLSTGGGTFDPLTTQITNFVLGAGSTTLTSATFLFTMEPILPPPPQAALTYTNIDIPGASITSAANINNSGQIAGSYVDPLGVRHGFVTEKRSGFTTVDFPDAIATTVSAVNNQGDMVGSYTDVAGIVHGFLSTHGELDTLDPPGSIFTLALGINDKNQIVGEYELGDGNLHGYLFEDGHFTTIDQTGSADFIFTEAIGINNRGEIAGDFFDPNLFRGFIKRNNSFQTFGIPSQADTFLGAINDQGDFVGSYSDTNLVSHGFLNQQGSFQTVDFPGAATTFGAGINTSGTIVGTYENGDGVFHSFLAEPGKDNEQSTRAKTSTINHAADKPVCGSAEWQQLAQSGLHALGCKLRH